MNNKAIVAIASILGVVFLIVAVLYFTQTSGNLPTFFPGYKVGSADKHMKHGIAAAVLGVACFIFGWFASGSKSAPPEKTKPTSTEEK